MGATHCCYWRSERTRDDDVADIHLPGNSMMHVEVNDAKTWHAHIDDILPAHEYGAAPREPPIMQHSAAAHCRGPNRVLWHLARFQGRISRDDRCGWV